MRFNDQLNNFEKGNFDKVTALIHLRKDHTALRYGDYFSIIDDKNIFAYIRSDYNERILVVLNKNKDEQSVKLLIPSYYNTEKLESLVFEETIKLNNNEAQLKIKGIGYNVYKLK